MKPNNGSPSYLIRNPYSYYFRIIVPKDLQKFVGRKELRYTLKTGYLGVAKQKARFVAAQVQLIFTFLRKGGAVLAKLSKETIQKLVHQYIKTAINDLDKLFYEQIDDEVHSPPFTNERELGSYVNSLDNIRDDWIAALNLGDFAPIEKTVNELLTKNGINHGAKGSLEYRKLCAEIHKAEIQLIPIEKRHIQCDFSYRKELAEIFPEVFLKPTAPCPLPQIADPDMKTEMISGADVEDVVTLEGIFALVFQSQSSFAKQIQRWIIEGFVEKLLLDENESEDLELLSVEVAC